VINFTKHGIDRGGLQPDLSPEKPRPDLCTFLFSHFHMGFKGNVVPCGHIRSDRPEHARHVVRNPDQAESIFDIYFGARAAAWRCGLVHDRVKSGPCATCTAPPMIESPANWREIQQQIGARHVALVEAMIALERAQCGGRKDI
jgi:hypothetical protein